MRKILLCLFMVFTLLAAPVAHAALDDCAGHAQHTQDKQDKHGMHHHCCAPALPQSPAAAGVPASIPASRVALLDDSKLESFPPGPLLEPPSHA